MKQTYMRLCLAFIGTLVLILPLQAAFQEGYVVTLRGDSLYGEIDMDSPQTMAHHCRFKSTETGKITRFKPKELKSFATVDQSRRFISGTVPFFFKDRHIFLEVLQAGRLNLYFTYDVVLNNLFYVSKRDGDLVDLLFDWDKNKLIPLKSDYVTFLKKAMVDAPELILDIERIDNPTPYAFSELVGRYNRRFDKSVKTTVAVQSTTVAKPDKRMGLSVSPGLIIPDLLYVDDKLTNVFCGLSLTKGPSEKRNGFYFSLGAYVPTFSISTKFGDLISATPRDYQNYDYMVLIPARLSYHFSKNNLQPIVGIDVQTYLNNYNSYFLLGPSIGLTYSPVKWVSFSCSFQYVMTQIFTKYIYYDTATDLNLVTGVSFNL